MAACWRRAYGFVRLLPLASILIGLGCGVSIAARAQMYADRYASIVVDAASGKVLEEDNADAPRHPASLAKLMTLYMTFEALRDRRLSLDEQVPVSPHAASMEPTKLGLVPGMPLTVEQAILGMVTLSANDAAAAMGELLGGSEDNFAQMMTVRARALGMSNTIFANASGLPAADEWTTARDMATLARRLIAEFPDDYHYFSTPSFVFHGRLILNHDSEMKLYPGADGLKTGYTIASGHNLVTSAMRDGMRLIGVVMGAPSNGMRDIRMTALLDDGYQQLGVPPVGHRTMIASRFPTLISAAQAEELPHPAARPARLREVARLEPDNADWAIQVGLFRTEQAARLAAVRARRATVSGAARIAQAPLHGRTSWRAQVIGLTGAEARDACTALSRHGTPCVVIRAEAERRVARG
jgi:D-alanyl-D-alanine carboxypeptidase